MTGTYKTHININPSAAGDASWDQVDTNFEILKEEINGFKTYKKKMEERRQTFTRVVLSEGAHPVTLLEPKDHENCKLIDAFVQVADNIDMDNTVQIKANGGYLTEKVPIKAGEKSGKIQSFDVDKHKNVGRYEKVVAIPNSVRKVIVITTWEEI